MAPPTTNSPARRRDHVTPITIRPHQPAKPATTAPGRSVDTVRRYQSATPIQREIKSGGVRAGDAAAKVDPTVPASHGPTTFSTVNGTPFRTDASGNVVNPSYKDVDQGNLGDCWLMAACGAVAHIDPQYLRSRITDNGDGTYDVKLGNGTETVRASFPDPSRRLAADPTPNGQSNTLWVALVERAYAQRMGNSYSALDGGNPGRALEALTGRPTTTTSITTSSDLNTLYNKLRAGKTGDHPMVVSTRNSGVSSPLETNHAYTVLDVYERDGQKYVKLYNPWGMNDGGATEASRTHEVRLEDLRSNCDRLHVSGG